MSLCPFVAEPVPIPSGSLPLPGHHARLASGCRPSSTGRVWLPAGSIERVLNATHPWQSSSFLKLSWRKVRDSLGGNKTTPEGSRAVDTGASPWNKENGNAQAPEGNAVNCSVAPCGRRRSPYGAAHEGWRYTWATGSDFFNGLLNCHGPACHTRAWHWQAPGAPGLVLPRGPFHPTIRSSIATRNQAWRL